MLQFSLWSRLCGHQSQPRRHTDSHCEREEATKFQSKRRLKLTCHPTLHELSSCHSVRLNTQMQQSYSHTTHIQCLCSLPLPPPPQPKWNGVEVKSSLSQLKFSGNYVTGIQNTIIFMYAMSLAPHHTYSTPCYIFRQFSIEIHFDVYSKHRSVRAVTLWKTCTLTQNNIFYREICKMNDATVFVFAFVFCFLHVYISWSLII